MNLLSNTVVFENATQYVLFGVIGTVWFYYIMGQNSVNRSWHLQLHRQYDVQSANYKAQLM
jgi:hypothetical protein